MWPMLIAAAAGALMANQKAGEDQDAYSDAKAESNRLNEVKSRYATFTGNRATDFKGQKPSRMGTMMQGIMSGASFGQQFGGGSSPAGSSDGPQVPQSSATPGMQNYLQQNDYDPTGGQGYIPGGRAPSRYS